MASVEFETGIAAIALDAFRTPRTPFFLGVVAKEKAVKSLDCGFIGSGLELWRLSGALPVFEP
jgi:hypothetical protein